MQTLDKTPPKPTETAPNRTKTLRNPAHSKNKIIKQPYKYTEQFVSNELDTMLEELAAQEQIKTKVELFETKEYSPSKFSMWKNKYANSKRLDEKMKKIESILESRLIKQGLTGKNFPFVIFLLKNHYGYQDKREVETETTHVFKVTRGPQTPVKALDKRIVIDIDPTNKPNVAQ